MNATRQGEPAAPTGKAIVLFSDGTGNSAAKQHKTNVWRLYQALDLGLQPAAGAEPQIALYDGGVGSSGFQPLAVLGGVFGFGLKGNVLDLYRFLCRNYQPGDRIYAFGFSRGAFTIRVLVGLVLRVGLVRYSGEQHLRQQSTMAYREYRRGFTASNLAGLFRKIRDGVLDVWRRFDTSQTGLDTFALEEKLAFVGVWDTVAAYGLPVAEMTRAFDRWVWPLSMPNYVLSPRVAQARHALALDDERDTFHPLLWDEVAEAESVAKPAGDPGKVAPGRLQQVWFAGMHADVGGGYPDNSLSYVSLGWMMDEAGIAGLRWRPGARQKVETAKNVYGPIHDSRAGMGTYYRYQPRKLAARLEPPDPSTFLMQDPSREAAHGRLLGVAVHDSVVERIRNSPDGYAPITLPPNFSVWRRPGEPGRVQLADGSERVWNEVWRRRINYFLGLGVTLLFLLMPLLPVSDCNGPQCLLAPAVSAVGGLLPDFLRGWFKAWADNPTVFLILIVLMGMTLAKSRALQRSLDDLMSAIWLRTFDGQPQAATPLQGREAFIARLRTGAAYQKSLQWLKWRVAPAFFGIGFLAFAAIAVIVFVHRAPLVFIDTQAKYCTPADGQATPVGMQPVTAAGEFKTANPCWASGFAVEQNVTYRLTLNVIAPWRDDTIEASPEGFDSTEFGFVAPLFAPLRRSTAARWFQPVVTLRDADGAARTFPVTLQAMQPGQSASTPGPYSGTFTAPVSGRMFLFANDVVLPWWPSATPPPPPPPPRFYDNNQGTAAVTLQRLPLDIARPH